MKVLYSIAKCKFFMVSAVLVLTFQFQLTGGIQAFAGIGEQSEFLTNGLNDQFSIQEQRGYNSELFEVDYAIGGNSVSANMVSNHELKVDPISIPVENTNTPLLSQNTPEPMQVAQSMEPMVTFVGIGDKGDNFEFNYQRDYSTLESPNATNSEGRLNFLLYIEPKIENPSFTINYNITERENGEYILADGDNTLALANAPAWQVANRGNKTYILGVLTIDSDHVDERDGLITITLLDGDGYSISETAADNKATITVSDNDLPTFTISGPTSKDEEADVVFTVTTVTGKIFADTTINVDISQNPTVDDQLLYVGANMMGNKTETVTFLASDVTASKMVTVTTEDTSGGTITATLAPSTNGSYHLAPKKVQVTSIIDLNPPDPPDGPVIELLPVTTATIIEGASADFNFQVAPNSTVETPLEVNLTIEDSGNFIKGTQTRTVNIGIDGLGIKPIPTEDDRTDEADGNITITIIAGSRMFDNKNYQLSNDSEKISQTIAVLDNDIPQISLTREVGSIPENSSGGLPFRIFANPSPHQEIDITLTIAAPDGPIDGLVEGMKVITIQLAANQSNTQGIIMLEDSDDVDPPRTITIKVAEGNGYSPVGNSFPNANSTNTITITVLDKNYKPLISIIGAGTSTKIDEADFSKTFTITEDVNEINGPVEVSTLMSIPSFALADFIVNYEFTERESDNFLAENSKGKMMLDLDTYDTFISGGKLYFSVSLFIASDLIDEPNGEITVTLLESDNNDYVISQTVAEKSVTIIVEDNDEPPIFSIIGPADGTAESGSAEFMVIAKDNTGRNIDPGAEIEIFYTVTDDPNGDFIAMNDEGSASTDPPVSFTINSSKQFTAPIQVPLDDDMTAERTGTISVTLTADENSRDGIASYTVAPAPDNQASAIIWDNDAPELTITGGDPVSEADTDPKAIFTIHSRVAVPGVGSLAVRYTPENANFIAPLVSGVLVNPTLPFADGDTDGIYTATIEIPIVQDDEAEASGNVTITLHDDEIDLVDSTTTFTYTLGTPASASVFVRDDDLLELTIAAANSDTVLENTDATAEFIITSSQMPPAEGLAIRYTPTSTNFLAEGVSGVTVTASPPIIFTTTTTTDDELYTAQLSISVDVDSEFDFPGMIEVRLEPDQSTPLTYNVGLTSTASVSVIEGERFASYNLSITADGTKQVEAGNPATFTISSTTQINNVSFPVFIEVTDTESFIAWRIPNSIRMTQNSHKLKIQTIANDKTEPGSITVTLIPKFGTYGINVDQYKDTIIVTNPMSDDGSDPTPEARISVADVVVTELLNLINPPPDTPAPNQTEARSEIIRPIISIAAINQVVDEGTPIELIVISKSSYEGSNLTVTLKVTRGMTLIEGPPYQNVQLNGNERVSIAIPTKNDNRAGGDGVVTVTLIERENYSISKNQSEVNVTISDAIDRQNRLAEITTYVQAFIPDLTGTMGVNSLTTVSNRIELGFTEGGNQVLELGGRNSIPGILTASGDAVNEDTTTLKSFLGDSSFAMTLNSGDEFAIPTTLWGLGDYQNLSPTGRSRDSIDWSGDLFTGHIGIDALIQDGLLAGISASVAESEVEFESVDTQTIEFDSRTTSLNPYIGWISNNRNFELRCDHGYGTWRTRNQTGFL